MGENHMITCSKCGEEKPETDFYKRGRGSARFTFCIECFKTDQKKNKIVARQIPGQSAEYTVIEHLKSMGIYAAPGKCSEWRWVDVVAWGCVRIEVKSSTLYPDNTYVFTFTPRQRQRGIQSDLVVLLPIGDTETTFHVFKSNDPIFYKKDGTLRQSVEYQIFPKFYRKGYGTLTSEKMSDAKDNWGLIEDIRQRMIINRFA